MLLDYIKHLKFPVLSANMHANGHDIGNYVKPYIIKHVGDVKVEWRTVVLFTLMILLAFKDYLFKLIPALELR